MQSRMDKYKIDSSPVKSRLQKNSALYEEVKRSDLRDFNINSNSTVLKENAQNIDVSNLRKMLNDKYEEPVRKTIDLNSYVEEERMPEYANTREYDLNAILEKAKKGKNVDYNKERLKKVRSTQYEILNNLDLNNKEPIEGDYLKKKQAEEENLKNLINTITELEIKNKATYNKNTSADLELLSDLAGDDFVPSIHDDEDTEDLINNITQSELTEQTKIELLKEQINEQEKIESDTSKIEDKEEKQSITRTNFDDFADISKRDSGSIIIKIVLFVIILALIFGGLYILNNILNLGLFK